MQPVDGGAGVGERTPHLHAGPKGFLRVGGMAAGAGFFSSLSSLKSAAPCGAGVCRCWCHGSKCCLRWVHNLDPVALDLGGGPIVG